MISGDVVAGGQQPTPHHHNRARLVLASTFGCLAFALVFVSGYLIGSSQPTQQSAAPARPHAQTPDRPPALEEPALQVGASSRDQHSVHQRQHPGTQQDKRFKPRFVKVTDGDSLWGIATSIAPHADPQATIERILKLNSLRESTSLEIGQRLLVPGGATSHHERGKGREAAPHRIKGVAQPVSVSIPRLNLSQDLVELNVIGGTLQVPTDYADVGWWRDGPSPGASGSAVLVGHVDSPTGPAVFYQLSSISIGDMVVIGRADGSKARFRVNDATLYPRESFPSASVYSEHGRPTLKLVTCGGSFDAAAGQYTGNLVVTALPDSRKVR